MAQRPDFRNDPKHWREEGGTYYILLLIPRKDGLDLWLLRLAGSLFVVPAARSSGSTWQMPASTARTWFHWPRWWAENICKHTNDINIYIHIITYIHILYIHTYTHTHIYIYIYTDTGITICTDSLSTQAKLQEICPGVRGQPPNHLKLSS